MAYRDFTLEKIKKQLKMLIHDRYLFQDVAAIEVSAFLEKQIRYGLALGLHNKKELSERIVSPILTELNALNDFSFVLYSGRNLDADSDIGLVGECDFMLAQTATSAIVSSPIFTIVEAKHEAMDKTIAQCAAQMIGAQLFNEQDETPQPFIFGAATTATEWCFLKLENNTIFIDKDRYYLANLPQLMGVLQYIIDCFKKNTAQ